MGRAISAADANRNFSELLRGVRDGRSYVVTNHGKPVAKIVPVTSDHAVRCAAREVLVNRLRTQAATKPIGRWTRDDLYDE
jgi:prevent-host-death family protein